MSHLLALHQLVKLLLRELHHVAHQLFTSLGTLLGFVGNTQELVEHDSPHEAISRTDSAMRPMFRPMVGAAVAPRSAPASPPLMAEPIG